MEKAKIREEVKTLEISGRKYVIKKFNAQTGSYIAYQLAMNVLPMAMKAGDFSGALSIMGKEQFFTLQAECLKVCFLSMPAGDLPIIDAKGVYAVPELENDVATIMALTLQALSHNVASFFDAPGSKELLATFGIKLTSPSDAPTSPNSFSSP